MIQGGQHGTERSSHTDQHHREAKPEHGHDGGRRRSQATTARPHRTEVTTVNDGNAVNSTPLRYCNVPRCSNKVRSAGRCPEHQTQTRTHERRYQHGPTAYNTARWRRLRLAFLAAHPLCVDCTAENVVRLASEVDHIREHRGDVALFFDWDNLAARCKPHHSRKTWASTWGKR